MLDMLSPIFREGIGELLPRLQGAIDFISLIVRLTIGRQNWSTDRQTDCLADIGLLEV